MACFLTALRSPQLCGAQEKDISKIRIFDQFLDFAFGKLLLFLLLVGWFCILNYMK